MSGTRGKQIFILGVVLCLGAAIGCAKKVDGKNGKRKGLNALKSSSSYTNPAKFKLLLQLLEKSDLAFQQLASSRGVNTTSPFGAVKARLQAHEDGDHLKKRIDACPTGQSKMEIHQDKKNPKRPITSIVLKSGDCAEKADAKSDAKLETAASFDFKPKGLSIQFQTKWLPEGFGHNLAKAGATATCELQLTEEQKLQSLKCQGLGQDESGNKYLVLSNFEFLAEANLINAQGSTFEAGEKTACDKDDKTCTVDYSELFTKNPDSTPVKPQ